MSKTTSQWKRVGSVKKSMKGDGFYITFNEGITLKKGDALQLQEPRELLKKFLEMGMMTEEQYQERLDKIPDFVAFDVVLPPRK